MATDALTARHQRAQLALRAAALRELLKLWPAFDLRRIARTWPAFEAATLGLIKARGKTSAGLASAYYRTHRKAAGAPGAPTPKIAAVPDETILAGLRVVGPVAAGSALAKARPLAGVAEATLVNLSGATSMYVLNFGRRTLLESVKADRHALGWSRVTASQPCSFCAMLASRGPVYGSRETASFEAHRGCACSPQPVYDRDAEWPGRAEEFGSLWDSSTRGLSTAEARLAFRRAYEGRS